MPNQSQPPQPPDEMEEIVISKGPSESQTPAPEPAPEPTPKPVEQGDTPRGLDLEWSGRLEDLRPVFDYRIKIDSDGNPVAVEEEDYVPPVDAGYPVDDTSDDDGMGEGIEEDLDDLPDEEVLDDDEDSFAETEEDRDDLWDLSEEGQAWIAEQERLKAEDRAKRAEERRRWEEHQAELRERARQLDEIDNRPPPPPPPPPPAPTTGGVIPTALKAAVVAGATALIVGVLSALTGGNAATPPPTTHLSDEIIEEMDAALNEAQSGASDAATEPASATSNEAAIGVTPTTQPSNSQPAARTQSATPTQSAPEPAGGSTGGNNEETSAVPAAAPTVSAKTDVAFSTIPGFSGSGFTSPIQMEINPASGTAVLTQDHAHGPQVTKGQTVSVNGTQAFCTSAVHKGFGEQYCGIVDESGRIIGVYLGGNPDTIPNLDDANDNGLPDWFEPLIPRLAAQGGEIDEGLHQEVTDALSAAGIEPGLALIFTG